MASVGVVETQSEFYGTYKKDTGDLAETMNEWVTNVVSATRDGSPARGHAHYDVVNGMPCLLLDSYTLVGQGDVHSMREMMSTGPGAICTGMHNEKGIGTRLLLTKLGGAERTTAEMLVVTADARNGKCALARLGRDVDAMYGDGSKMARMAADAVFDANLKFSEFAFPSSNPGEKALAQNILLLSGHPYQEGENLCETRKRLGALAQECMDHAEVYGVFTRFLFFHLGTTGDQEPVAGRRLFSVDPERGLLCNDVETPLSLCEFFRESYVPPELGLYPLTASDAADATKGRKEFTVQGAPVFDTPSFLLETHHDEGVLASDVMRIDCGNGRSMYMRAYWPTPENSNGRDRLKLHQNVQYATGTYLVYKDKILNPYHPKSLNLARKGEEDYYGKALSYAKGTNLGPVKKSLMGKDSAVRSWLGFKTWAEWTAYGLPSPADIHAGYDKDRLYEMLTLGAIFVVRIDEVLDLNTPKTELRNSLEFTVQDVVHRIRRAQVLWCLTNKPQERLAKEQLAREAAAARGEEEVVVVVPPKKRKPQQVTERTQPPRKRQATVTYQPEEIRTQRRGPDRRALLYDFVREMAKTPTDMMGLAALRAERDKLIQTAFPPRPIEELD